MTHFKTSALALAAAAQEVGTNLSTADVLYLTEALIKNEVNFVNVEAKKAATADHDSRVLAAVQNFDVMEYLVAGKKIQAIKEVRILTGCGLKEAKDAVEDQRVERAKSRMTGTWGNFDWTWYESLDHLSS